MLYKAISFVEPRVMLDSLPTMPESDDQYHWVGALVASRSTVHYLRSGLSEDVEVAARKAE